MRIRRKPWARPELAACPFFIDHPTEQIGRWNTLFARPDAPIHLELGCGKGGFISQIAPANPQINYIAVDIKSEMLGLAKRKLEQAYRDAGRPTDNILLTAHNIEQILTIFHSGDAIERIYINFCNPWPRHSDHKKRLTYLRQLRRYQVFLTPGAQIWFKTDDDHLFDDSLEYFAQAGFSTVYCTRDLHASGFTPNYQTEHEQMFSQEGIPIKFTIVQLPDDPQ